MSLRKYIHRLLIFECDHDLPDLLLGKPFACKKIISKLYCHCMFGNQLPITLVWVGIKSVASTVCFMGLHFVFVMETVVNREVLLIDEQSSDSTKVFSACIN